MKQKNKNHPLTKPTKLIRFIKTLPLGQRVIARVTSQSMVPSLYPGDQVVITRQPLMMAKVRDVVAFPAPDDRDIVLHRVVSKQLLTKGRAVLRTKGDNNISPDPEVVREANFLGIATPYRRLGFMKKLLAKIFPEDSREQKP